MSRYRYGLMTEIGLLLLLRDGGVRYIAVLPPTRPSSLVHCFMFLMMQL